MGPVKIRSDSHEQLDKHILSRFFLLFSPLVIIHMHRDSRSKRANMNSIWFDFDEELSREALSNSERVELLNKNFGLSSKKMESERKLKSWTSVSKVSDIFDLDDCGTGIFKDRSRLWDSVIKDRVVGKNVSSSNKCRQARERIRLADNECDDLLTDISESVRKIRDRFSRERFDSEMRNIRETKKDTENSPGCSSTNSFSFPDVKKDPESRMWSRKSSYQGNVTFPESSNASVNSDAVSEKSFGRSVSINSEESVCTEKSADCSSVCETLPDGTSKTRFENNETWLTKSTSGSTICEKKVNDSSVTEQNEDTICDRSKKRTSYIERTNTGSSLQEESTSERMVSCDKNGTKTVEQKMSSETYKKSYPKSSSMYLDESNSNAFQHRFQKSEEDKMSHGKSVSEKISKLIDEAVHQDSLFRIPLNLETDIDKMRNDFCDLKSHFTKEKRKYGSRRLGGISTEAGTPELSRSKYNELKAENEALLEENSKLQSIIQDVTAVNKRWQKYNNERRLYVQKLLSTIQDLQEQINLISEKSAFRTSRKDNLFEDTEEMKREFQERITVLELQIKSHKDDWEAEKKEKQKAIQEKEDLETRLQELMKETKFLKNVLLEEKRTRTLCSSCKNNLDEGAVFPGNEFFPSNSFAPDPESTALHVPYKMLSSENRLFPREFLSKEESADRRRSYYSNALKESCCSELFSESFSQCKKTSGDTIVVEDENGLRLSITEQFPSKDTQMKSILKKVDKKLKRITTDTKKTGKSRRSSADERKLICEQDCELSFDFENQQVPLSSFSPHHIPQAGDYGYHIPAGDFLKVSIDSRSKSEPNTRSNSSENLKPLRESSSWNNQCASSPGEPDCSQCGSSFSPSMPPEFVNHYESNSSERNHF